MRNGLLATWLAGFALSLVAGWATWRYAPIADADLRIIACFVPVTLWSLTPVVFWRFITGAGLPADTPNFRDQRRAVLDLLAERGLSGRRARYSVPFYLVVGAPGAGKSSLLQRSGLNLSEPRTIGGADWWVGEDAVFIEVSLGLPDRDPRQICDLAKNLRPLLPINGTVFVLSPADLTLADRAEHRELAQGAAQGLRDIEETTGQNVPIYVALAKIDLLPGFLEFFDRQEPQERSQPWGFALPFTSLAQRPSPTEANDAVANGFHSLLAPMRARLIEWLSREADPVRCARINSFGAQIAGLQSTVHPILEAILPAGGRVWQGGALRGIYLTSARQEALSIDGLLPELSRRFAMPRIGMMPPDLDIEDEDQGFFIAGTFRKAIFPEAGLAGRENHRRAGTLAQWGAMAAIIAACAGAGYHIFQSFGDEVRWAARGADMTVAIKPIAVPATTAALPEILASMQRLDAFGSGLDTAGSAHGSSIGLAARPELRAAVDAARSQLTDNAFAPSLIALLENGLVDFDANVDALRARLALTDAGSRPNEAAVGTWLAAVATSLPEDVRALFLREGTALFTAVDGKVSVDPAYIDAARRIIAYKESLS